ncbi:hypothetical protein GIB67_013248 [Kingdonia uniflora]|uniref:RBR-type E3 ubiquitin transferase n=1 Tax=Kingdonia uniflora TaxID=39325 RepID=A0A7J7NT50_9MAGN|nr:hypothetical protein GIB67_013248 [Kingdonia uniflora]
MSECRKRKKRTTDERLFFCEICMEEKQQKHMSLHLLLLNNNNNKNKNKNKNKSNSSCNHPFCTDCLTNHVSTKIQQNNVTSITCPTLDCLTILDPHICEPFIPKQLFHRWMNALCESSILGSQKFYCPFKNCSAMLLDDASGDDVVVRESECPYCHRLFCVQCKVPWHSDMGCDDFQKLGKNEKGRSDRLLMDLASKNKWMRCPNCKFYVDKKDGCLHITCRFQFTTCHELHIFRIDFGANFSFATDVEPSGLTLTVLARGRRVCRSVSFP